MDCQRCERRAATTKTFVVDESTAEYWELCDQCCEDMVAEADAAGLERVRADPLGTIQQMETNLGRPLNPDERADLERYLAQAPRSSRQGSP